MHERPDILEHIMFVMARIAEDIPLAYQETYKNKHEGVPVIFKKDGTPLTKADQATEQRLIHELTKIMPGSQVLGEETVEESEAWRDSPLLQSKGYVWIVDPIDGTFYFYRGQSFGMLIGLRHEGVMQWAISYYPREHEFLWVMRDHEGAFHCRIHDGQLSQPHKISMPLLPLKDTVLGYYLGSGDDQKIEDILDSSITSQFRYTEPSLSVAIALRRMLSVGDYACLYANYKPWDFETTALIARKAGAEVTHFDGTQSQTTRMAQNVLFAPCTAIARRMQEGLKRTHARNTPIPSCRAQP